MRYIRSTIIVAVGLLFVSTAFADWVGGATLTDVSTSADGLVYVGTSTQPANTCNSWGWYFVFDASTPGGKNMLASLLTAKMAGKTVNIWYSDSPVAGTNQTTGCNGSNVSTMEQISIPN